jgi:hypothetical protein
VPIRPSTAADVDRLIAELSDADPLRRETAVARLSVIGARAITKLSAVAMDTAAVMSGRVAAVQALEAIADARSLPVALALADDGEESMSVAAVGLLGALARGKDARAPKAFGRLAAVALQSDAPEARRLAALAALDGLSEKHATPIFNALREDANPSVRARVTRRAAGAMVPLDSLVERGFPQDPAVAAAVVREEAETAKVTTLRRAIEAMREREQQARPDAHGAWMAARGLAHQALAARGSRLAMYDLRESLEHAKGPLPVGFLAATAAVGDATCLEPLAAAWLSAPPAERWWREHLAETFRAVVTREGLTRRHPALKKLLERRPDAGALVGLARKT